MTKSIFTAKSVVLILGVALTFLISCTSSCYIPKDIIEFVWEPENLEDEGYYFPMGSLSKNSMNHTNAPANDITLPGVSKTCPARLLWKLDSTDAIFYGCGSKQSHFSCQPMDEKLWILDCRQQLSGNDTEIDLSHRVYATMSDGKTYTFINRCFYNAAREDWIVFSTTKDLPPSTKFDILVHAALQDYWSYKQ